MSNFRWEGTKISPSLFLIFGRQTVPAKNAWRLPLLPFWDRLFCLVMSQANYSISEGLAIVRLTRHRFLSMRGQFNGCLHENGLATENPEKRRAYSSAFSSKIWHSRVICVFLRWGLTPSHSIIIYSSVTLFNVLPLNLWYHERIFQIKLKRE